MPFCEHCGAESQTAEARFCASCGAPLGSSSESVAPPAEPAAANPTSRKTVTLLFSDVSGSTAMGERLDPESVREIMNRYFELSRVAIERHGGTVEKYIGDAVMAAFGIPSAREDDALRALRAAAEIKAALKGLDDELLSSLGSGLAVRIGINTGEVIVGDPSQGQAFASGDAVNVAARFEQAAPPGEVLLSERTYGLVRDAIDAEAVEPLTAKGKSKPLAAYRLISVRAGENHGIARRLDAPLVGRKSQLQKLDAALNLAVEQRRSQLALVLGEAGLGKSRLTAAFAERVGTDATVIRARCPSYGEGALYPIQQALLRLAGINAGDEREAGWAKLHKLAAHVDDLAFGILATFLGVGEGQIDIREASWAVRRLLDTLASEGPVVLAVDDAHWADEALLDLAVDLAAKPERSTLVLLIARPELLERESHAEFRSAEAVHLRPLEAADEELITRQMLGAEPPAELLDRLRERTGGNPLYLEELLRSLVDRGLLEGGANGLTIGGEIAELPMPDSVEALLAARIEALPGPERSTLEAAAVPEGSIWPAATAALLPERSQATVTADIDALLGRGLLVRSRSVLADQHQYRFSHILMREAAYGMITKRRRAQLHERLAGWLEERADAGGVDFNAAIGRHLAAAHGYRQELGAPETELTELARRATRRLAAGVYAALEQEEDRFATDLNERALDLAASAAERAPLLVESAADCKRRGETEAAIEAAEAAIEAATVAGDLASEWSARVERAEIRTIDATADQTTVAAEARAAIAALSGTDHDRALSDAWGALAYSLLNTGQAEAALKAMQHKEEHARRSGRRRSEIVVRTDQVEMLIDGPATVTRLARHSEDLLRQRLERGGGALLEGYAHTGLGFARGAQGRLEEARDLLGRSVEILEELNPMKVVGSWISLGVVELWAGEPGRAEAALRRAGETSEAGGHGYMLNTSAALLGDVLARQGRMEDAEVQVGRAKALTAADDVDPRVRWRYAAARTLAIRDPGRAASLASEATEFADETDLTPLRADAWLARAEVALMQGNGGEAAGAARTAETLYRDKGVVTAAATAAEIARRASRTSRVG